MRCRSLIRTGLLLLVAALVAGPALAAPGRRGGGDLPARLSSRAAQHRPPGSWVLSLLGVWPAKPGMIIDPDGVGLPKEPGMIIDPNGVDLPVEPGMIIDPSGGS